MKSKILAGLVLGSTLLTTQIASAALTYAPVGPQTAVPVATVTGGGWRECYRDLYNHGGTSVASILSACGGTNLMLACRPTGNATLTLLAQAPRADVITDTGTSNTPHDANGVGWYFSNNYSWGFALQGDTLSRSSCDANNTGTTADRLCFHTGTNNIAAGYRCGATTGLNASAAWERVIYDDTPPPPPAPTLSEWALIAFAMLIVGFGVYQQRRRQL